MSSSCCRKRSSMVTTPGWVEGLMGERFFEGCGTHDNLKKNEKNIFCLDCCLSFCSHCLPSHAHHPLLQVRRYVYHDVVRMDDLEKLIACDYIQPYTINSAKVIFLNERAQSIRSCKGAANFCLTCTRILQESFHFCSLSCKVNYYKMYHGDELSSIIYQFNKSDFAFSRFEGLRILTDRSVEPTIDDSDNINVKMTEFEEPLKILDHSSSRRKGAPHRAPLL